LNKERRVTNLIALGFGRAETKGIEKTGIIGEKYRKEFLSINSVLITKDIMRF